jgi:hypothetical protein
LAFSRMSAGRRATSPLALRAMSEALAGDRGDSHGSQGSAVAFRCRSPGAAARQGDRRASRRALHQHPAKGCRSRCSAIDLEALVPVARRSTRSASCICNG